MKRKAWNGEFEIPKRLDFPGVKIKVRIVPEAESAILHENDGVWFYNHDKQSASILIDGRLPLAVQRYTLIHECQHAFSEMLDVFLEFYLDNVMPCISSKLKGLI